MRTLYFSTDVQQLREPLLLFDRLCSSETLSVCRQTYRSWNMAPWRIIKRLIGVLIGMSQGIVLRVVSKEYRWIGRWISWKHWNTKPRRAWKTSNCHYWAALVKWRWNGETYGEGLRDTAFVDAMCLWLFDESMSTRRRVDFSCYASAWNLV